MCLACLAAVVVSSATSVGGLWGLKRITGKDINMKKSSAEVQHKIGARKEWLAARLELLKAEKEHTRRGDELAQKRQELPWVRVDKDYRFETEEGTASLSALFRGRSQLLVYHFMFGPDYTDGCPSCSAIADGFNGFQIHLANHDVMLWAVWRAPVLKLQAYKRRMRWTFPWASSFGSDFNSDYSVGFSEEDQREGGIEYNYRREDALKPSSARFKAFPAKDQNVWGTGVDWATYLRERPGVSAFVLDDGIVYHTYSTYARARCPVGHAAMARPRSQRAQRDGPLVASTRRVRQAVIQLKNWVTTRRHYGKGNFWKSLVGSSSATRSGQHS
jgi:predicted dithiol-disulfide oxidoreductase (DUF899 family)